MGPRALGAGLALALSLGACETEFSTSGEPFVSSAVLRGQVLDQGGTPVVGASMQASVFDPACFSGVQFGPAILDPSDNEGKVFRVIELVLVEPFLGCIVVSADPPVETGLRPDSVALSLVRFETNPSQVDTADFIIRLDPS